MMLPRYRDGFGSAGSAELGQDPANVELDRSTANVEALGYLGIGQSFDQQGQYLLLSLGQIRTQAARMTDRAHKSRGSFLRQHRSPSVRGANRLSKFHRRHILEQIADGPGL